MEKLLDADAVLRYLLEDIQEQSDCVAETIEAGAEVTVVNALPPQPWAFTAEVRSTSSIACWQPKFPRTDERPSHSTRGCKASLVVLRKAIHARLRARRSGRDD